MKFKNNTMKLSSYPLVLLSLLLLSACSNLFDYHAYDTQISGETGINAKNKALIEVQSQEKKNIKFAFISDTQRWYDETEDVVAHINNRGDIDFVIHGGDLSDFGATREFMWQRDILNKLTTPYVCLLGNHDCIGSGKHTFEKIFGNPNFTLRVGNTLFVCLNTNALEYDYSEPVPDFFFLESQLEIALASGVEQTIVLMHAPPFDLVFNNNVASAFQYSIKRFPNLLFCVYGHNHNTEINDFFNDGINYYGCTNIKDRRYFLFTLTQDSYEMEEVSF